jgi:hypothetical protein
MEPCAALRVGSLDMPVHEPPDTHVVGVFQDVAWARRGVEALVRDGFSPGVLTVMALASADVSILFSDVLHQEPRTLAVHGVGVVSAEGPLLATLQGDDDGLAERGLTATIRRAGFQAHDGQIFERLLARGGVLVGILSEPRAADALARLLAYGGGNAAIGAWSGRV